MCSFFLFFLRRHVEKRMKSTRMIRYLLTMILFFDQLPKILNHISGQWN